MSGSARAAREAREALWYGRVERFALDAAYYSFFETLVQDERISSYVRACEPMVDATIAGAWQMFLTDRELLVLRRPGLHWDERDLLHREDGPAIEFPQDAGGERVWFWHGVEVNEKIVLAPDTLSVDEILNEPNAEVRRVMIERFGPQRVLEEANAKEVAVDDYGKLWRLDLPGDEPLVMVELINSTAEPDGSFKTYWLRVPPDMRTAREAVAWTFEIDPGEYELAAQT